MDAWAGLGNKGWDWHGMEAYFSKFQTVNLPDKESREELEIPHAGAHHVKADGPIQATFPLHVEDLQKAWIETWRNLGLKNDHDPRLGRALGGYTSSCHITSDRHERSHAGVAFYKPIQSRNNLTLVTGACVTKIIFDRDLEGPAQATGVLYRKDGKTFEARSTKSVILAAGTFATPQILELSGIGDQRLLEEHKIPIVYANSNVGENLQDHLRPGISLEAVDTIDPREPLTPDEARKQYQEHCTGPMAENACFAFAYQPLVPFLTNVEKHELSHLLDKHLGQASSEFERRRNDFIRSMIESPDEATVTTYLARKPATEFRERQVRLPVLHALAHVLPGQCPYPVARCAREAEDRLRLSFPPAGSRDPRAAYDADGEDPAHGAAGILPQARRQAAAPRP